jgi:hypothetical protein
MSVTVTGVLNTRELHHRLSHLHYTALLTQQFTTGDPKPCRWAVTGVTNKIRKKKYCDPI